MRDFGKQSYSGAVIVLGGGIAGLTAAARLVDAGWRVLVIEATDRCGGLHHDRRIGRYTFDPASIFYEETAPLFDFAPGAREECPKVERIMRRIDTDGVIRPYPLRPAEALAWPLPKKVGAALSLVAGQAFTKLDGSLDAICRKRLGNVIYDRTNLRGYIERFNRASAEQIDEAFFYYRMSLIEKATRPTSIWRALRHDGRRWTPKAGLRIRPESGYGAIFGRIVSALTDKGVHFAMSHELSRLSRSGDVFEVVAGGEVFHAELVLGALPLDILYRAAFGEPSGLKSVDLMTLFVSADWLHEGTGNVLYNFDGRGDWKRATVYSRLFQQTDAGEFFSVEVTLGDGAVPDPERAFNNFSDHMAARGLAGGLNLEGHEISPYAYPSYSIGYRHVLDRVRGRLSEIGVALVGRQGAFEYYPTATGVIRHVETELDRQGLVG